MLSPSGASTRSEVIGRSSDEEATSVVDDAGHHVRYRHEMVSWIRKGPLPPRRSGRADRSDYRPRGACLHAVCVGSVGGDDRAVRRGRDRLCEAELIPAAHLAARADIEVEAHRSTGARAAEDDDRSARPTRTPWTPAFLPTSFLAPASCRGCSSASPPPRPRQPQATARARHRRGPVRAWQTAWSTV